MKFLGIIPARYASTRFPAKPLAMLGGKTVIQRVYEQVAGVLDDAYVATDDERLLFIIKAVRTAVMKPVQRLEVTLMSWSIYKEMNLLFSLHNWMR